ncbi:ABC transporter ATP-binding protein [Clostridium sp. Marseille-P2415]|uniref:ABC transporter ATP-binding protein n=1 Tax=Clostridium sp. Marseille-P2415 TaxID=1805471 RepID=UPI000988326C|nr:ABC transporter ATP-binding protein [Clostridium sp. Marseille-P2415]
MKNIRFERVNKAYGKNLVVNDLNIDIREGERLVLLGPSGCGKSTTLRMIAGLENITSGNLYMGDKIVNCIPSSKRNVAMVFQNYALFPHMTVEENISYGLKVNKLAPEEIQDRTNAAITMLNLNGLENRKPKHLSGGQRQRVALARAVVKRSDYFLLDEPLSNLDAQLRLHARKELVKIHELYNQTLVYVTHDQVEAMTVGHRIALMSGGVLQMVDTPSNVYNRPANVFTAKFIGSPSMNVTEAKYHNKSLFIGRQQVTLPDPWLSKILKNKNEKLYFGIRPEHTKITTAKQENALMGIVKYKEDYGNRVGVFFEIDGAEFISICTENIPMAGEQVFFMPDFDKIHLFDFETTGSIGYPDNFFNH